MKVRIVCSATVQKFNLKIHQAFIYEQVESLKKMDPNLEFEYFFIEKSGVSGYLKSWLKLRKQSKCDLIHAHGGLPALLSVLIFREPVISTFHGSDVNLKKIRIFSAFAALLSNKSIYVSKYLQKKSLIRSRSSVIPCGVDLDLFKPMDRDLCCIKLGLPPENRYLLFASAFSNPVKNYSLLEKALEHWPDEAPTVLELKGISREMVPIYMNAANVCVLTSLSEGSPQFVKEALACNRPLVSTAVGDVTELIDGSMNCRITKFDPEDLCKQITDLIKEEKSDGRKNMVNYNVYTIASQIINLYKS
jgi:glycosyltransferase involved in cell wall biosynthesis